MRRSNSARCSSRGKAAGALLAQQPGAEHVFVDLRLQLELEQRDRLS